MLKVCVHIKQAHIRIRSVHAPSSVQLDFSVIGGQRDSSFVLGSLGLSWNGSETYEGFVIVWTTIRSLLNKHLCLNCSKE